ncbi:cyclin-like protein [Nitzschia inconspicua]|uniref:Cyclin-like protein n=1 Tax=Nitzschia inconspicua TaxID=303405 RepID=A0A9K3Q146_9STRA|nr:cyclin-like protein [Nitzschia inconspicua]
MFANRPTNASRSRVLRDVSNSTANAQDQKGKPEQNAQPIKRGVRGGGDAFMPATRQQSIVLEQRNPSEEMESRQQRTMLRTVTDSTANPAAVANNNISSSGNYQFGPADNIDERDAEDPLCATAYVQDMYEHFRGKESATSVRPLYMENQPHINERMRSILVDWLVEVHLKFKLVPETLYLTINLIDRYLTKREVSRPKLQLVGVTSLLIASKYEEIYPPELRDLVYICDRAYSRTEIIEMEETILKTLEYNITIPSAHAFLVRFLKAAHADKKIVQLSCYILDGTLQSYNLLHYLPSQLAAAAVFIARRTVGRNSWSPTLLKYADYREEDIAPVARAVMNEKSSASPELRAVNKNGVKSTGLLSHKIRSLPIETPISSTKIQQNIHNIIVKMDQLSPEQRQAVLMQAQQEANQRIMQDLLQRMVKTCFNKCAGTSGDRLDSREQSCMASCQDQYFETRSQVQKSLEQRQSSGM